MSFLNGLASDKRLRPDVWYLIATAASTSLGFASTWVPRIYAEAVAPLGPPPATPTPAPPDFASDPLPRRKIVRRMKEALVKCVILSGVPRAIQGSFAFKDALQPGDRDSSFVRSGFGFGEEESERRGTDVISRVYQNKRPISGEIAEAMRDIEWLSLHATYGLFLSPIAETSPSAPLTFAETEMVILSCLIAQRAAREVSWHFKSAIRNGFTPDEVEAIQEVVESVAAECGTDAKSGMPRIADVECE